ncbi:hypothetical protein AB1046_16665 [Promicromonospora sp. Populi]|uniref:hypothetical protein n=1 Tax=Promicromonospora sp. Populi TaxID=3239420 RepID=UPI0034E2A910
MSHRTQITLEDAQYERLLAESRQTGLELGELVRRAVDRTYGGAVDRPHDQVGVEEFRDAVDRPLGAWSGRDADRDGQRPSDS